MPVAAERFDATTGIIGTSSLCETVTTGKCLIGLSCGSISSVTQNRTNQSMPDQSVVSTALTASVTRDSSLRNRSCSSTA